MVVYTFSVTLAWLGTMGSTRAKTEQEWQTVMCSGGMGMITWVNPINCIDGVEKATSNTISSKYLI